MQRKRIDAIKQKQSLIDDFSPYVHANELTKQHLQLVLHLL